MQMRSQPLLLLLLLPLLLLPKGKPRRRSNSVLRSSVLKLIWPRTIGVKAAAKRYSLLLLLRIRLDERCNIMALVEAKNPAERKKMIVAIVLGSIAIISLAYMLFGSSSSSNKNINGNKNSNTSSVRPSPTPPNNIPKPGDPPDNSEMLTQVVWPGAPPAAPEAGRNIFAYYVPPTPTPPPPPTPIPTPPPPQPNVILSSISPVNVYAHTGDFNLDVTGDKFTPDTRIFIGGAELQTRFVSPQQLSAKVPAQIISFEGARAIKIQSRDGKLFSNTATLNVMPAPVPNYTFIGVQIRKGANDQ